jgi:hypothetical protein
MFNQRNAKIVLGITVGILLYSRALKPVVDKYIN